MIGAILLKESYRIKGAFCNPLSARLLSAIDFGIILGAVTIDTGIAFHYYSTANYLQVVIQTFLV